MGVQMMIFLRRHNTIFNPLLIKILIICNNSRLIKKMEKIEMT